MWQIVAATKAGCEVWILKDPAGFEIAFADPLDKWILEDLRADAIGRYHPVETAVAS